MEKSDLNSFATFTYVKEFANLLASNRAKGLNFIALTNKTLPSFKPLRFYEGRYFAHEPNGAIVELEFYQ